MAITTAIRQWSEDLIARLVLVGAAIVRFIPGLVVAILALVVAWIAGKILERLAVMGLEAVKFDEIMARGPVDHAALERAGAKAPPSRIAGALIFWATFFFLGLGPAADALGLQAGRVLVERVIVFLPAVLGALLVVAAAFFIGGLLLEALRASVTASNLPFGRELGWLAYFIIVLFGLGVALTVLDMTTSVILAVIGVAGGTVGLALAIGFGVGARDVFGAIAAGRELRDRISEGDEVTIDSHTGTVERVGLDAVELRTAYGLVSIPNTLFIQKVVVKKAAPRRAA